MLTLSKEQKESLVAMRNTQGFQVMRLIEQEHLKDFALNFAETFDIKNPDHLKRLEIDQLYIRARTDFMNNAESNMSESYAPDIGDTDSE
jgi:hypothetical protein